MKLRVGILLGMMVALGTYSRSQTDSVRITFRTYQPTSPTVFVPGQFNNWGNNVGGNISPGDPSEMAFDTALGAWTKTYKFKLKDPTRAPLGDSVYQYKFNRGGVSTGWYPDPLNSEQNPNDNNNSVLRLSRLFWFEFYAVEVSQQITRITIGLVHANSDTIISVVFATGQTLTSPLTATDVTGSYDEASRILDFNLSSPIPRSDYVRLVARNNHGDSTVYSKGGYSLITLPLPAYAGHGVTLPSAASGDSATFRLRVSGKDYVLLRVAPVGQPLTSATPVVMRKAPTSDDWWMNMKLQPGTMYEYSYEIENGKQIYDPWGRWNGTNGSRFSTGPEGLTADNYTWKSTAYQRPTLNKLVIYELNVGEFAGGYYNLSAGQATFNHLATLMPYLDSLGINAIELMPVNDYGGVGKSGHSWGYDLNSYFALEPGYGDPAGFKALVDSAHAHGIAVIADVVFNHLNDTGPLWQMQPDDAASPYFKSNSDLRPNEDALFFFKDMDHWAPETQEIVYAVLKMWIDDYKVDGFRYDYTQGVGWDINQPTKGILGWANRIDQDYGGAIYQIAEHLPESPALLFYSGLTSGWHDSFRDRVFDEARFRNQVLPDIENLVLDLGAFPGNDNPSSPGTYADRTGPVNATVNHDEQSLIYEMITFQGVSLDEAIVRDKLYGTLIFTSLGVPMLWQGMEFSAPRGWPSDGLKLSYRPVEWYLYPTARGQSHYHYYQALIRQRIHNPALFRGTLRKLFRYSAEKVLVWGFEDALSNAKIMVVANFQGVPHTVSNVPWLAAGPWYNIFDQSVLTVNGTSVDTLGIPAYTAMVYSNVSDSLLLSVEPRANNIPTVFTMSQNYPNPFNPSTMIHFDLPNAGRVSLKIYDVLGRQVAQLVDGEMGAGSYTSTWDGRNANGLHVGSGVYLYHLTLNEMGGRSFVLAKKMVLVR